MSGPRHTLAGEAVFRPVDQIGQLAQLSLPAERVLTGSPARTTADAFVEELFQKHHGEIYAYLVRMLRDPELAADLTQDAFIKAYRAHDSLEDPAHARAWLYQIAHRVALDEIRRRKIVRFLPWTGESYGSAPSAEHLALEGRLSSDLQRALARIPERQRAALLLAELHDLTGLELASALGVSHVAARALLTRARDSLRRELAAERDAGCRGGRRARRIRPEPAGRDRGPWPRSAGPAMTEPMSHERARRLAAGRLDEALAAADEAALEAHLADCGSCRASVAGYEADRLALRALPPIEPPRDLWARTSAALEREHARHPRAARRTPRRWGPVAVLGSGFALVLVIAIVGPTLLGTSRADLDVAAPASGGGAGLAPSSAPGVTPLTVPTSQVTWVVTKGSGGLSLVTASVNKVCPTGDEPDCAPLAGISRSLASLPTVPSSLVLSPSNAGQAVAIGPAPNQVGTTLFVMAVPAVAESSSGLSSSPLASAGVGVGPAVSPVPGFSVARDSDAGTGRDEIAGHAQPHADLGHGRIVASSAGEPCARWQPGSDSCGRHLAIMSNVTLVGDQAAYSPDGLWFAFSARPAGTSTGPDVYVWQAGWPAALPITADHGSVFSGWVDGQILASRAVPVGADSSPSPGSSGRVEPGVREHRPRAPASTAGPAPSPSVDASALPQASPSGLARAGHARRLPD